MGEAQPLPWPPRREADPGWRRGASAVASLSFDVDGEAAILAHGEHYAEHLSTMSHQAYGPRVGVPRILELLARLEVGATFFVPGVTAQRWPGVVEALLAGGHEVSLHGHRHVAPVELDAGEQEDDLGLALEALRAAGAEPRGYRAPFWQQTRTTLDLLAAAGLDYDSSLMDDDRPYLAGSGEGWVAELPVHWSLDDWEQYAFLPDPDVGGQIETPAKVLELWTGELAAMRATGSLCLVTGHPFLSGRPSRLRVIERFVAAAREYGDVELARCDEIAARVLGGPRDAG